MSPEDIKKLLGGYATGTLTEAEQQALFAAALEDQELFDALANEQPLRDLLTDPCGRATLLTARWTPRRAGLGGFWQWLRVRWWSGCRRRVSLRSPWWRCGRARASRV